MEVFQDDNVASFTTQLNKISNNTGNNLPLGTGSYAPEITDLATWGIIANDGSGTSHTWYANQGNWRTGKIRLILIFADSPPAGTDDYFDDDDEKFLKDLAAISKINDTRICRFGPHSQNPQFPDPPLGSAGTLAESTAAWQLLCDQTDGELDTNYSLSAVNNAIVSICQIGCMPYTTTNMTNYSWQFDEEGSWLDMGDASYYTMPQTNATTREMSVSFWMKPITACIMSGSCSYRGIWASKGSTATDGKEWEIGIDGSDKLYWKIYDATNTNYIQIIQSTAAVYAEDVWQHVCCTWDGTVADGDGLKMYITTAGGVTYDYTSSNATCSITGTMNSVGDTSGKLLFGSYVWSAAGSPGINGRMADISYWNDELSEAQVELIANRGTPNNIHCLYDSVDLDKLVGYWRAMLGGTNYTSVYGYLNRNGTCVAGDTSNWVTDVP